MTAGDKPEKLADPKQPVRALSDCVPMTWWPCGRREGGTEGGVLELDGVDLELELRFANGRTMAWWVHSQTGAWLRVAPVGRA